MKKRPKVFVGMSGGVDSSVSAALLKADGYDVTGVFIKTWSPEWLPCTWREERRDAMRAAAKLKIPLITLDLEKEYREGVTEYMIEGYKKGIVPNPDVMCNKVIKFGGFFDFAMKNGADYVATGHYAMVINKVEGDDGKTRPQPSGQVSRRTRDERGEDKQGLTLVVRSGVLKSSPSTLFRSKDENKDQTYFLWMLGQRQLSKTLFPIGDLKKSEVRKLAKKFGLLNAEKKDSQGLCFMGDIDVKNFLKHYIEEKRGKVLSESGEVIGEHDGVTFFTIGERHGFRIDKKGTHDRPYYVIGKDVKKNILIVSDKKYFTNSNSKELTIKDINWNQGQAPSAEINLTVQIRYHGELHDCNIEPVGKDKYNVIFKTAPTAPSPGQSVVFYSGNICLGGGVIV